LGELRAEVDGAYPVAVAQYISPQGAALLKRNGLGYLDLSGNCFLAFGNVLIEKEGKPNLRPSTRPLKALFAPRATRVVRALLVDPGHLWRLDELARASEVSLGHAPQRGEASGRSRLGGTRGAAAHLPLQARRPSRRLGRRLHLPA
jgi:hypothetical protein